MSCRKGPGLMFLCHLFVWSWGKVCSLMAINYFTETTGNDLDYDHTEHM